MDTANSGAFIGEIAVICFVGGLLAGMIAYSKSRSNGTFVVFFIFGALLPLIGIIVACLIKPLGAPAPGMPPGWYADPWQVSNYRWWDGYSWSASTA